MLMESCWRRTHGTAHKPEAAAGAGQQRDREIEQGSRERARRKARRAERAEIRLLFFIDFTSSVWQLASRDVGTGGGGFLRRVQMHLILSG